MNYRVTILKEKFLTLNFKIGDFMKKLQYIFEKNKLWAENILSTQPDFFKNLAKQQNPEFLWIGCSDSRVPANQVLDLPPGEVFVHRNVANQVIQTDMNMLSVVQYAVEALNIKHIIVCGHYGCGGIKAVIQNKRLGLIDNWLRNIKEIYLRNYDEIVSLEGIEKQVDRLCEINTVQQALNLAGTTVVHNAWDKGADLTIHSWIYGINNGLLKDLKCCISSENEFLEYTQNP